ncbi:MAG: leucine-rich repeat domain-containing protein [Oscillospiraceae bacterium]
MKKKLIAALSAVVMLCSAAGSTVPDGIIGIFDKAIPAAALTSGDFDYNERNGTAEITGYHGMASELVIPRTLDGFPVTAITGWAFVTSRSYLTSVSVPEGVTEIAGETFFNCKLLSSVTMPQSITAIGENAFAQCEALTSVNIPSGLTTIGECAFADCTSLANLTIPNSVTSIGAGAFYNCTSLAGFTIPNGVTSIGESAFYGCTSLASLTIPYTVTSIGEKACGYCYDWGDAKISGFRLYCYNATAGYQYAIDNSIEPTLCWVNLSDCAITVPDAVYNGAAHTPAVTVQNGSALLSEGTDYSVSFTDNLSAGTATVTVTALAQGYYTGTLTKIFHINKAPISDFIDIVNVDGCTYSGLAKTPGVIMMDNNGSPIKEGKDYTLIYKNNLNAGTASVTVTGIGNYTGTKTLTFKIAARPINGFTATQPKDAIYTGKAIKPTMTLKYGTKTLVSGTDYTVTYAKNTAVGEATVTINGKGNYTGTITKTFMINPKSSALSSVTAGTKKATLKYTKVSGVTGYQIFRATAKAGAYLKIKTTTATGYTNTGLTKGRTYYYKVRTYKTVSGVTYYSTFSTIKSAKAK